MRAEYLRYSPATIRFKVMRVLEEERDCELTEEEVAGFKELIESMEKADRELEETLRRFPRYYYRFFNKPAFFTLTKDRAVELIRLLEEKSGVEMTEHPVKVGFNKKSYIISLEFPCG